MASVRSPVIRHVLFSTRSPLRIVQKRWARVHDVRFLATHQDANSVIEKYKHKLDKKAKEEGHESISSLKEAYKDKIINLRRTASTVNPPPAQNSQGIPQHSPLRQPPPPAPSLPDSSKARTQKSATPGIKPLSSYLSLEKVAQLPAKEIEMIWRLRFASDPQSLCAVIPLEIYNRVSQTGKSHPQFILPLPRELPGSETNPPSESSKIAADIHFLQWNFHPPSPSAPQHSHSPNRPSANTHTSTVLFTHLAAYKLHGSYAPPHTTITHHLDLADSHGLVLLNGSVIKDKGVSVEEGKWLVMQLQRFYDFDGMAEGRRRELVEGFTGGDGERFRVEDLVEEAGKMS